MATVDSNLWDALVITKESLIGIPHHRKECQTSTNLSNSFEILVLQTKILSNMLDSNETLIIESLDSSHCESS